MISGLLVANTCDFAKLSQASASAEISFNFDFSSSQFLCPPSDFSEPYYLSVTGHVQTKLIYDTKIFTLFNYPLRLVTLRFYYRLRISSNLFRVFQNNRELLSEDHSITGYNVPGIWPCQGDGVRSTPGGAEAIVTLPIYMQTMFISPE